MAFRVTLSVLAMPNSIYDTFLLLLKRTDSILTLYHTSDCTAPNRTANADILSRLCLKTVFVLDKNSAKNTVIVVSERKQNIILENLVWETASAEVSSNLHLNV